MGACVANGVFDLDGGDLGEFWQEVRGATTARLGEGRRPREVGRALVDGRASCGQDLQGRLARHSQERQEPINQELAEGVRERCGCQSAGLRCGAVCLMHVAAAALTREAVKEPSW